MKLKGHLVLALGTTLCIGCIFSNGATARRVYTITTRQEALAREIAKDQKTNELTKKEADGLREDLKDIASRIKKLQEKNGGKLSYKDEGKIEKDLNDVSLHLKKLELNKRVEAR
jgi:septal ring factor EnvC (AmiA/AmiB activator)